MKSVQFISDTLWDELFALICKYDPHEYGAPRRGPKRLDSRKVYEAILYREATGCAWNNLPEHYPCDTVVYMRYRHWDSLGLLSKMHECTVAHGLSCMVQPPRKVLQHA